MALVVGLGGVALAHDPFPEMKQKIETRLQNELAKVRKNSDRAKGLVEKRSGALEKRAPKEAERIQKIQAEIATLEQKVAAAKTPEGKELLTLRLDVARARLDLAQKEAAFEKRALELGKDKLTKLGINEATREQAAKDRAAKALEKAQERAQKHLAKEARKNGPAQDETPAAPAL